MSIFDLADGYVPAVTEVNGVAEFERALSHWVNASNRPTVGLVENNYGGSPVIGVRVGADRFVLNRDTPRPAVRDFLATAARAGGAANLHWHVTTNERGRVNKISYLADDPLPQGWFVYIRPDADAPRPLG
jgi:hypothetical protein